MSQSIKRELEIQKLNSASRHASPTERLVCLTLAGLTIVLGIVLVVLFWGTGAIGIAIGFAAIAAVLIRGAIRGIISNGNL